MSSSLYLTRSKPISVGERIRSWSSSVRHCLVAGLSPGELLLRQDRFALIINLFMLKSWSKGSGGMIELLRLLDSRLQLQQRAWHLKWNSFARCVLYRVWSFLNVM